MKNWFFTLLIVLGSNLAFSQQSLKIKYVSEWELDLESILSSVPSQFRAQAEPLIRQELSGGPMEFEFELVTNGEQSQYSYLEQIDNGQSQSMIRQSIAQNQLKGDFFKNLKDGIAKKEWDFLGESYIIIDTLRDFKWKIGREKLTVAGFQSKRATGIYNDSTEVVAYYTPKIGIKDGPDFVYGLPGLITRLEYEQGKNKVITYIKEVEILDKKLTIGEPRKGKAITEDDVVAIVQEFQKKQKESFGGGVDTDD